MKCEFPGPLDGLVVFIAQLNCVPISYCSPSYPYSVFRTPYRYHAMSNSVIVRSCPVLSCALVSCHVLSCPVLHDVMSCHALSCRVVYSYAMSCHYAFLSCHILLCHFMSLYCLPCLAISCHYAALSCAAISCHALMSFHVEPELPCNAMSPAMVCTVMWLYCPACPGLSGYPVNDLSSVWAFLIVSLWYLAKHSDLLFTMLKHPISASWQAGMGHRLVIVWKWPRLNKTWTNQMGDA